ncbi:MAG: flippase-like domain-containing protein [Alphaproteobacteria bacterium]|nr:flippase-like domain-containing protein [Alphaproteobacteria bacterium]
MKLGAIAALLAGLALAVFLLLHIGLSQVLDAIGRVGWAGFALICIAGLGVECCLGTAWYALAPKGVRWRVLTMARQLRDSASDLLPFTQVGGMVIGARAGVLGGMAPPAAFATMMVDVTTELMAQIAFIALGLLLGLTQLRASATMAPYADAIIIATVLLIPGVIAFVVLQRRGSSFAEKLAGRLLPAAVSHTEAFSKIVRGLYKSPLKLALSSSMHLTGWIASGIWIWLVMQLVGADVDVFSAIAIESLLGALRSATVFVPSAIGVQEAGYAALAPVFGMGPEIGLAVSLLKRARDVAVGVPVLLFWQAMEGKRAFAPTTEIEQP